MSLSATRMPYFRLETRRRLTPTAVSRLMHQTLAAGRSLRVRVRGYSMAPLIREGDRITLAPVLEGRLPLGAPVAVRLPFRDACVVHRIVDRRAGAYRIKGDNLRRPDGWVSAADVLGIVRRVERNGRCLRLGLGPEGRWIALGSRLPVVGVFWRGGVRVYDGLRRRLGP